MTEQDRRFEEWLQEVARNADAPPATPRDAMWENISARLAAEPATRVTRSASRRTPWIAVAGLAAALLLGIGIDRMMLRSHAVAPVAPVASVATVASVTPSVSKADVVPTDTARATEREGQPLRAIPHAQHGSLRATRDALRGGNSAPATPNDLYKVATVQMLAQAEVLLTSYRASEQQPDAASMQRLGLWAKDVLSSTRLLIDSPVGNDKRLRPLLDDLELVLVQLVHVSGAPLSDVDRASIDRALRDHDLLPRIRSAVPSGTTVPTV